MVITAQTLSALRSIGNIQHSLRERALQFFPGRVRVCPPAVYTELSPSTCHFSKLIWWKVSPSTPRPLGREQVVPWVPAKRQLRAGGGATSFPDETGLPGHQLLHSEGRSDKEPDLNSCNAAVCNIEYLRHLLGASHYKWMERIQECFIRWGLWSEGHTLQSWILIRHYLYL